MGCRVNSLRRRYSDGPEGQSWYEDSARNAESSSFVFEPPNSTGSGLFFFIISIDIHLFVIGSNLQWDPIDLSLLDEFVNDA
jgi:hypothetical protein